MVATALDQSKKLMGIVSKMSVLVADDFSSMRSIIVNTLRSMGFTKIDQASNGKAMLQLLDNNQYEIILCDWNMPPFMDGVEVLETLKEKGKLEDIIFIMITAERAAHNVIRAAEAILDGYIVKPIRAETVERMLTKILLKKNTLKKGKELFSKAGVNEAIKHYEKELSRIQENEKDGKPPLWLHKAIAETYEKAGDLKKAFEKQVEILKINPQSAWTYEAMGQIYKKNGNTEKAIEAFKKALSCNEQFMRASDSLANIYLENSREDDALAVIERASEFGTDNVKRQILLERIYFKKQDYTNAEQVSNKIIELQPRINITENHTRLAKNLMMQEDKNADAYKALMIAINKRDPITTTSASLRKAYIMRGEVSLRFKNIEKKQEGESGFKYVLNKQKRDKGDDVSRDEIESEILEIYKRLGIEDQGNQVIKKLREAEGT